jgi:hypothetical protein
VVRSRWEAQSPAAQPHQEGVTETSVSVEMGASKPGSSGFDQGRNLFPPPTIKITVSDLLEDERPIFTLRVVEFDCDWNEM